jgi:glycosyltransferase involved in cell wall biosynthesis
LRVVLTIHHFPPNYSAGAEVYAFRLAGWLVGQGHEVEVVCVESIAHEGGFKNQHDIYEGISVWRLHYNLAEAPDPFRQSFDNPTIGRWFAGFLQQVQPDIVHVNSCYLLSASTIAATKQQALPLVVTLHDFWFVCPRITLLKPTNELCTVPESVAECAWCLAMEKRRFRWSEAVTRGAAGALAQRWLVWPPVAGVLGMRLDAHEIATRRNLVLDALKQADVILSPSEFLRSVFVGQGINGAQIRYSRLGLDTSHWITPPASVQGSPEELRISYIGQLSPHKGVHLLIEAFNRLRLSGRRARLKIYGGLNAFPGYVRSLRRAARGNPAIEFAGRFDNHRVAEVLGETDVVVVPSIWYENSPITIMEALTTGTPVVASNLGGMPELVHHDVNGLLFEVGNAADLADQLQRLVDEPELVAALASNAHPVRMIDDEMTQILSLYRDLVN